MKNLHLWLNASFRLNFYILFNFIGFCPIIFPYIIISYINNHGGFMKNCRVFFHFIPNGHILSITWTEKMKNSSFCLQKISAKQLTTMLTITAANKKKMSFFLTCCTDSYAEWLPCGTNNAFSINAGYDPGAAWKNSPSFFQNVELFMPLLDIKMIFYYRGGSYIWK